MSVLILGASGILGQHMRLAAPLGTKVVYARREPDLLHVGCDLSEDAALHELLEICKPSVIVNFAGESRPDTVERDGERYRAINSWLPRALGEHCDGVGAHYIHISSQAVFDGAYPPYGPGSLTSSPNVYGWQKIVAETAVRGCKNWTIIRPTFVLGIRPLPHVGRPNPVEQMLAGQKRQVADRFFSPLFARDAARLIWAVVQNPKRGEILHLGNPERVSRYSIAQALGCDVEPAKHEDFPGLAARPLDTTWAPGSLWLSGIEDGLRQCREEWQSKITLDTTERAREIALFLGLPEQVAFNRLNWGFHAHHAEVAADFRKAGPKDDKALLAWYRKTDSYIWELSAYHADPGFNYAGMCRGIADRLTASGVRRVLCLGDGIGDLTLSLRQAGIEAVYHDLAGSRTADFAAFRYWMRTGTRLPVHLTGGWEPAIRNGAPYDAVISLDFMEHVTDVPGWTQAIRDALAPGGFFMAQNAFAIGSGEQGSIPMHLERNDRYEREWNPLLVSLGFERESANWYRRAS